MLDSFFGSLSEDGDWARCVSPRGFAQARDKLSWGCLERLNAFVVKSADAPGLVPRWHGLRLVAAGCVGVDADDSRRVTLPDVWPVPISVCLRCIYQAVNSPFTPVCMAPMVV